jgi:hypothetical protein
MKDAPTKVKDLESIFTRKGVDALLPSTMNYIFKENTSEDFQIPSFMTKDRLIGFHKENIGLISFLPKTIKEMVEVHANTALDGQPMILPMCLPEWEFWNDERPQQGLCLMSVGLIRSSTEKRFSEQTEALESYIDVYLSDMLPELIDSKFWRQAKEEFRDQKSRIKKLMKEDISEEALEILCTLKINQMFRPKASELVQQIIAYGHLGQVYPDMYSCSNSYHNGIYWQVTNGDQRKFDLHQLFSCSNGLMGCSFICRFDELLSVI